MTRFSAIAHTPDGKAYVKHIDAPAWEAMLALKVLIGAIPIVGAYYVSEWPVRVVLCLTGITVLIATAISTRLLLTRDVDAHRAATTPHEMGGLPIGANEEVKPQVIMVNHDGKTTQIIIDHKDDELVKLVTKLLDASIKLSSPDVTTFPTTRALDWPYADYDRALRALGIMVKRGRGVTPVLTFPHTLATMREAISSGALIPYRQDAPPSWNRIK